MKNPSVISAMLALLAAPVASALVVFGQPAPERIPTPHLPATSDGTRVVAPRPGAINHVVLVTLKDPADAAALIADTDRLIGPIPSVKSYFCGPPRPSDRSEVDSSFTVGLYVGFESQEDYQAYLDHQGHRTLEETWRPRIESIRIFDITDPTP